MDDTLKSFVLRFTLSVMIFLMLLFSQSSASEKDIVHPRYSLKIGMSLPGSWTPLGNLWQTGYNIGLGLRLPFAFIEGYNDFWISGEYTYFGFKKEPRFPVDFPYGSPEIKFWGEPARIYTVYIATKIYFVHRRKRFNPYVLIGSGYIHRSDAVLSSDSELLPYSIVSFNDASAFLMSIGADYRIKGNIRVFIDFMIIGGETQPSFTKVSSISTGISLR
jgi:hypothetical protein